MSQEDIFSFNVTNTNTGTDYNLDVIYFKGSEEIGELYSYEIDLASKKEIDIDDILSSDVCLVLHNKEKDDDTYIHGVLRNFEMHQELDDGYIHYKAYLVPKLWRLTLSEYQQIFIDQKVNKILETILGKVEPGFSDYRFKLERKYSDREYVCQYKESYYDFFKRWMEREGIYFYFEQSKEKCKVIITDDKTKNETAVEEIKYQSSSKNSLGQSISSIVYRSKNTIDSIRMKNYKYEYPSARGDVKEDKYTKTYLFGNNLLDKGEAEILSNINLQKAQCLEKEMIGESNIVSMTPGHKYKLTNYFNQKLNEEEYLMLRIDSEGYQRGHPKAGLSSNNDTSHYTNTFTMIPSKIQFRSQTTVPWPHIGGMLSAKIDASTDSEKFADIDEQGRYSVIMPFDISGRRGENASCRIRMAQPSAGKTSHEITQGFHFPLHPGTEVLISFIDGDPDQPVIMGAVPNTDSLSPVIGTNKTKSVIRTHTGNVLEMDDDDNSGENKGNRYIKLGIYDEDSLDEDNDDEIEKGKKSYEEKHCKNYIKVKAAKKGTSPEDYKKESGIYLVTEGNVEYRVGGDTDEVRYGNTKEVIHGHISETQYGNKYDLVLGAREDLTLGGIADLKLAGVLDVILGVKFELQVAAGMEFATKGMLFFTPESKKLEAITTAVGEGKQTWYGKVTEAYGSNLTDIDKSVTLVAKDNIVALERHSFETMKTTMSETYHLDADTINQVADMMITRVEDANIKTMRLTFEAALEIALNAAIISASAPIITLAGDVTSITSGLTTIDEGEAEEEEELEVALPTDEEAERLEEEERARIRLGDLEEGRNADVLEARRNLLSNIRNINRD